MPVISSCTIDGYEMLFVDGDILLKPDVPLGDFSFIAALRVAQKVSVVFVAYTDLKRYGDDLDYAIRHGIVLDDVIDRCIDTWRIHSASFPLLSGEVRVIFPAEIQDMIDRMSEFQSLRHPTPAQHRGTLPGRTPPTPAGFVYLLRSSSGYYKIGRTKDPNDRIATFAVKLPFEVEYEHIISCSDMMEMERSLHARYADRRVNGEWFDLNAEDIAYIKSIGDET